jgi:ACS family tartrate transporter-like MFS transporter
MRPRFLPERSEFERPPALADPIAARALGKASWRLIPLLGLGYGIAIMDRVNISFASLQMNRDLHFSNTVYGFGAGLFFLAYSACEVPSNLMLYRFGARRWLARIMVTWGILAMAMVFVRTPWEFYAARFLLGMAEAGFFPGVIFYLMQWFPPAQRARTVSRFYIAAPLSSVFMGSIAGALLNLQGKLSLAGWQWLFLVQALPAVLLGIVIFFYLPDTPAKAAWLSEPERSSILAGLERNPVDHATSHRVWPALRDARVWLLGSFMFCMLATSYAYLFYAPILVKTATGLDTSHTGYVIAVLNLFGAAAMIANGAFADRSRDAFLHIIPGCVLMSVGFLAASLGTTPAVSIGGLLLVVVGQYAMQGPLWVVATAFFSGRSAAAAIAAMNTIGILGGFVGPYWMGFAKDLTGSDRRGLLTMAVPMLVAAGIMLYLRRQFQRTGLLRAQAAALQPANL